MKEDTDYKLVENTHDAALIDYNHLYNALFYRKMKEEIDYKLVENTHDPEKWAIEILQDPYKKTVYYYETVALNEKSEEEECELTFNFHVIACSDDNTIKEVENDTNLQTIVGDILTTLLTEGMIKTKHDGETGNNNTQ